MSMRCKAMFMPMSSMSPFMRIMPFIIFMPSKYFNGPSGNASCLIPLPSQREVLRVRSSDVASSS